MNIPMFRLFFRGHVKDRLSTVCCTHLFIHIKKCSPRPSKTINIISFGYEKNSRSVARHKLRHRFHTQLCLGHDLIYLFM